MTDRAEVGMSRFYTLDISEPVLRILREFAVLWLRKGDFMSKELDALKQQVAQNRSAIDSAIELIQGLAQQIEDSKEDPQALQTLADELRASDSALASAVAANTPAESGQPSEPPGETAPLPPSEEPIS